MAVNLTSGERLTVCSVLHLIQKHVYNLLLNSKASAARLLQVLQTIGPAFKRQSKKVNKLEACDAQRSSGTSASKRFFSKVDEVKTVSHQNDKLIAETK